jgi:hypothetical protein
MQKIITPNWIQGIILSVHQTLTKHIDSRRVDNGRFDIVKSAVGQHFQRLRVIFLNGVVRRCRNQNLL